MRRSALGWSILALAAAVAAAVYLIVADTYSSQSCSAVPGGAGQTCVSAAGSTLIEENGRWVLWYLAVPIGCTVAVAAVIVSGLPAWPGWVVALFLLSASTFTALTIGAFFLPAALLALLAVALYGRARRPQTEEP